MLQQLYISLEVKDLSVEELELKPNKRSTLKVHYEILSGLLEYFTMEANVTLSVR